MNYSNIALKPDEQAVFSLRELYGKYGYTHYKMGKFEEYDLYARNRSFLISDNILTFTDTNGKLMALKPDVTLSIVKNIGSDDTATHKLFYNENVYRTSASSGGFREIMQTGLECIGNIDTYLTCEVLSLARDSLGLMNADSLLVLSHMGYTLGLLEACGLDGKQTAEALEFIKSKNTGAICALADEAGVDGAKKQALVFVTKFYGTLRAACDEIGKYTFNDRMCAACDELYQILDVMGKDSLFVDFSVVNDMNYYDGVIFNGYIDGIPESILSGGRYDRLVSKMGKKAGAIGFAVYMDLLERFGESEERYDADVLLVYGDARASDVAEASRAIIEEGKTVNAVREDDGKGKYKEKRYIK